VRVNPQRECLQHPQCIPQAPSWFRPCSSSASITKGLQGEADAFREQNIFGGLKKFHVVGRDLLHESRSSEGINPLDRSDSHQNRGRASSSLIVLMKLIQFVAMKLAVSLGEPRSSWRPYRPYLTAVRITGWPLLFWLLLASALFIFLVLPRLRFTCDPGDSSARSYRSEE